LKSWNDELEERVRKLITAPDDKKVGEISKSSLFTLPNKLFDPISNTGTADQGGFGFAAAFVQQAASRALFADPNRSVPSRTQPFCGAKSFKQPGYCGYRPGGLHYRNQSWKKQGQGSGKGKGPQASGSGKEKLAQFLIPILTSLQLLGVNSGGRTDKAGSMTVDG
jgi:hypothetical protein